MKTCIRPPAVLEEQHLPWHEAGAEEESILGQRGRGGMSLDRGVGAR